ncbi:MAG TPA: tetratricopeptide repeat protein [Candidatus Angelobacter sp.]|nr:tetratricopeptide repeat protein [Candidatus Angelobacter sp.]
MPGYTRRQLKEDKFAETAQGAAQWATGHRQTVILAIGVVLVVILATIGFMTWRGRQTEQANVELSAALRTFNAPLRPAGTPAGEAQTFTSIADRAKAAEKQFQGIADKYSGVPAGKMARYLSGIALLQAGDNAGAEKDLKTAADSGDKNVASLAKMALASIDRSSNRNSDAVNIYKSLIDHPTDTVSKQQAQLELAELYEKTDPQQAITLYQQLQKDNPQTPVAQIASQKLAKTK